MSLKKPSLVLDDRSTKSLITFQFYYVLIFSFAVDMFHLPTAISYVTDIINLLILLYLLVYRGKRMLISEMKMDAIYFCFIILIGVTIVSALINLVNPLLVVWSGRNHLRFFPYFFACVFFEDEEGLGRKFNALLNIQKINFVITLYQFFYMNLSADYLGGIFGTSKGCNGFTNIFLCIISIYALIAYSEGERIGILNFLFTILSSIIVAALAEIKVFFVELVIILILYLLLSRISPRKIFGVLSIVLAVFIGFNIFSAVFPQSVQFLTNLGGLMEYGTGTGGGYALGRLGAYKNINELIFHNDVLLNMLGYGFGNCEYSSYSFFTSQFYLKYGSLNYRWFSNQMWFLQCGYAGVISYIGFIACIIFNNLFRTAEIGSSEDVYRKFAIIFAIIVIISFYYNQSCSVEISYISFYALAAPFVARRSKKWETELETTVVQ